MRYGDQLPGQIVRPVDDVLDLLDGQLRCQLCGVERDKCYTHKHPQGSGHSGEPMRRRLQSISLLTQRSAKRNRVAL